MSRNLCNGKENSLRGCWTARTCNQSLRSWEERLFRTGFSRGPGMLTSAQAPLKPDASPSQMWNIPNF